MKKSSLFISLTILFCYTNIFSLYAQNLSAYTDYMGHFYVFDHGKSLKVEDLPPESFEVGGECIIYVASGRHLKMYADGKVSELEKIGVSKYYATDYLAAYNIYEKLKVVYQGKILALSSRCSDYMVADSLVIFYDKNAESMRVFYKGKVSDIESGIMGQPVKKMAIGDNIFAYVSDRTNDFKVWYENNVYTIERNVGKTEFKAGRDVVAFIDETEQNFKAYYKGDIYVLDDFEPVSYQAGNGFVAFVSQVGEFKVFSNGEVQLINSFAPQSYIAKDEILAYVEDGYFKIWYEGKAVEIEHFVPLSYKMDWNTLAYLDHSNRIWLYQNGEKRYLLNDFVNSFEIYRNLVQMNVKVNKNIIYYENKFYDKLSDFK
jgi:hypothetical protein